MSREAIQQRFHELQGYVGWTDSDAARIPGTTRHSSPDAGVIIVSGHSAETVPLIKELSGHSGLAVCYKPVEVPLLLAAIGKLV